jgi:23S rRNA (cytosine1962-C5)-methyltransferase
MHKIVENKAARIILKSGREKSARNRHPWLFSGAVGKVSGRAAPGDIVTVVAADGSFIGKGFWNPHSQIRVRVLTFAPEAVDEQWLRRRLQYALVLRRAVVPPQTDAYRLINADGDMLPGLIVDRYADVLVLQISSLGMQRLKPVLLALLQELTDAAHIFEKTEGHSLESEGLKPQVLWHRGGVDAPVIIRENGLRFAVDVREGQKTGFFLDQRDNRRLLGAYAAGKTVLNCFSYSGGFSVYAAQNGAATISVDISEAAIALAKQNFELNNLPAASHGFVAANVFEYLREAAGPFDVIVLDPPAFVKNRQHLQKGARAYKDINRLAMQKIAPGGLLLTCSCSSHVDAGLFRKIVFSAAQEAGRECQILAQPSQPPDHPINIYHPEGEYLKTLLLRIG